MYGGNFKNCISENSCQRVETLLIFIPVNQFNENSDDRVMCSI